jgi:hypothetical protein
MHVRELKKQRKNPGGALRAMKGLTKEDDSTTVKYSVSTMGNQPVHSHLTCLSKASWMGRAHDDFEDPACSLKSAGRRNGGTYNVHMHT